MVPIEKPAYALHAPQSVTFLGLMRRRPARRQNRLVAREYANREYSPYIIACDNDAGNARRRQRDVVVYVL